MSERPPERDELDLLLDPLLRFAQEMLRKQGEFLPFGGTITSEGQVSLTATDTGDERPPSQEVIELLASGMRAQATAGQIRAAAICYNARFTPEGGEKTDAIAVSLDHRDGDATLVMQPYSKGRFTGLKFGQLVVRGAGRAKGIFAPRLRTSPFESRFAVVGESGTARQYADSLRILEAIVPTTRLPSLPNRLGSERSDLNRYILTVATETIYVELLDEGVDVWRPVDAEPLGDGRYRLLPPSDYDPEIETWAFLPGTVVRREARRLSEGTVLVAVEDVP